MSREVSGTQHKKLERVKSRVLDYYKAQDGQYIGHGSFAAAFSIKDETSRQRVVIKFAFPNPGAKQLMREELMIMDRLASKKNPYVVSLIRDVSIQSYLPGRLSLHGFKMPYYAGGSLQERLKEKSRDKIAFMPEDLSFTLIGMSSGLAYLHEHRVIHYDVTAGNVVFQDQTFQQPVLIDLGLAKVVREGAVLLTAPCGGTPQYMSPEVIVGMQQRAKRCDISFKTDVYSMAWLLCVLWHLDYPFLSSNLSRNVDIHFTLIKSGVRPKIAGYCQRVLAEKIKQALDKNPTNRPSASDLLTFFKAPGNERIFEPSVELGRSLVP